MALSDIVVKGASEHNLRSVDVTIPRLQLTTITGVSGSGKSSLAFDTIYQEGQRRYVESLSAYARQFLGRMEKPRVERIDGLSPTLLIDQKTAGRNPRSTVGTITEIHDHLRLLFARLGVPHCPECGAVVQGRTVDGIVDALLKRYAGKRVAILAPVVRDRKGEYRKDLEGWRLKGYGRIWVDGVERRLDEEISLVRNRRHTLELVVDRLKAEPEKQARLAEAVEAATDLADGLVNVRVDGGASVPFSTLSSCPEGHGDFPELEPRLFSFNSPHGACAGCEGLGSRRRPDPRLLIANEDLSIREGALKVSNRTGYMSYVRLGPASLTRLGKAFDIDLDAPWKDLPQRARDLMLRGSGDDEVTLAWDWTSRDSNLTIRGEDTKPFEGILPALERHLGKPGHRQVERFCSVQTCPSCQGTRLNAHARAVLFRGLHVADLSALTLAELGALFDTLELDDRETRIGAQLVGEIRSRLAFLGDVGVGYLRLDRGARTLSGGEAQRVRLATQVGSGLQGVLYVLDEPSIGLHPRDNKRLISTLGALRDRGNTVLVVEHDEETILATDHLIDIGPGAGSHGGEVLASGPTAEVLNGPHTLTTDYLTGRRRIEVPSARRAGSGEALTVVGARQHNLRDLTVRFPLASLIAVTGVSGSGKSTLVDMVLRRALAMVLHAAENPPGEHDRIDGLEHIDKVIEIDQQPIGRTPRSNPATYTGLMNHIRDLYAGTPESKVRGYGKGRFSFNVKGGRCEECEGAGVNVIEMQFLPDVQVSCEVCEGRRYNSETLEIQYRGKAVDEILGMSVDEALEFFEHHKKIRRVLDTLAGVGLNYITLGQPSTTLSGGEAQRVKLASELCRPSTGRTFYILDEPTTGLHFEDVRVLVQALQELVEAGNTVLVVEHNLDVVKCADHVIDLGPDGGDGGGALVGAGTPEEIAAIPESSTGQALRPLLKPRERRVAAARKRKPSSARPADLVVRGASIHNLDHIDVTVPHGQLTVITGPSGSGKTSLAFDTIFAEGQRRYVESLSTYARRFLSRMDRPPVDRIDGLAPAIAIDQKTASRNPRSTVATSTEIHDYFRLLWSRAGTPHCWKCGKELKAWSPTLAAQDVLARAAGQRLVITASLFSKDHDHPTLLTKPGTLVDLCEELQRDGFVRVLLDGDEHRLDELPKVGRVRSIELVVDRLKGDARRRTRLAESLGLAQQRGLGLAHVRLEDGAVLDYEARAGCARCDTWLPGELSPRMFSFNSHVGACESCEGLGRLRVADVGELLDDPGRPLLEGAMTSRVGRYIAREGGWHAQLLTELARLQDVDIRRPWSRQPQRFKDAVLHGLEDQRIEVSFAKQSNGRSRSYDYNVEWDGLLAAVEGWWRGTEKDGWWRRALESLMSEGDCPACRGGRLRPWSLATTFGGEGIAKISRLTVTQAREWFDVVELDGSRAMVAEDVLREVRNRLAFLENVGLGYLSLDRGSATLSGGEAQRIRLASQLGNRLVGVLYVLDEPSIGLHPRDQGKLLDTLRELRDLGNTIVVVEHDRETIEAADHVLDMGPGAGRHGGKIVARGTPEQLARSRQSLTGKFLSGRRAVPVPAKRREATRVVSLEDAQLHNLAKLTVDFPVGVFTVVTGVSGSGKSTLVTDLLVPAIRARLEPDKVAPRGQSGVRGAAAFDRLLLVDQAPIGRSPHSNPATYTGVFDDLRALFAASPEARMRGFGPGRFSTNVSGGRCEACSGRGVEVVEMHFLSDVELTCESCHGRRFNRETLAVKCHGFTIADVLEMDIGDALEHFGSISAVRRKLGMLVDVGLGYLKLGQPATTLSGGEAQRVKLASELGRPGTGRSLIVLDEPTTGLHFEDVGRLVAVLQRMVDQGNTVVVIEHNLDVIKSADHVIDLGPEGGSGGGQLVAVGTPEQIAAHPESHTGRYLVGALPGVVA